GQEVSQTISALRVLEITTGKISEFSSEQCGFSYRSSIFNQRAAGQYIVLEVTYRLKQNGPPTLKYADLQKFFAAEQRTPSLQQVRDAVRQIRRSKAMLIVPGDEDCRSAGSFFKNPTVSADAAWLVERAGFHKGYSRGAVGISRKHSLAIVNRGGATAQEIMVLKNEIEQRVFDVLGVRLQPEPVFVRFRPTEKSR